MTTVRLSAKGRVVIPQALLGAEAGGADVADLLRQAGHGQVRLLMSWVNLGEVAYIVERRHGGRRLQQVLAMLEATALEAVAVDQPLALAAAHLQAQHAIARADAFAAALTLQSAVTLVTGDPEFRLLEGVIPIRRLPCSP